MYARLCGILILAVASLGLVLWVSEYPSRPSHPLKPSRESSALAGTVPFQFDPAQVSELVLAKDDPESGDRWMVSLEQGEGEWNIRSEVNLPPFLDRKANNSFLFHLLDSVRRIRLEECPLQGTLESFGLDPPRFAIRWKANLPGGDRVFELRTGVQAGNSSKVYVTLDGSNVLVGSGSAFRILNLIDSIHTLRNKNWSSIEADDVDEIEFRRKGRSLFYAQRDGNEWTDRRHRPVRKDTETLLSRITDAQAEGLIDNPQKATLLKNWIQNHSVFEVVLTDRGGQSVKLKLMQKERKVYGVNSERPSAVFELHPKILEHLSPVIGVVPNLHS